MLNIHSQFDKEEHDKQAREEDDTSGSGNVFRGPQGLCPRLQGYVKAFLWSVSSYAVLTRTVNTRLEFSSLVLLGFAI